MEELNFSLGVKEFKVNGSRVIRFNPSDVGFAIMICALGEKLTEIQTKRELKAEKSDNAAKIFDYDRLCEKRMREAIDEVFGEGFCDDVFQEMRLQALSEEGLMLHESFLYTILDQVADSTLESLSHRNARIAAYTAKYQKIRDGVSVE